MIWVCGCFNCYDALGSRERQIMYEVVVNDYHSFTYFTCQKLLVIQILPYD